MLGSSAGCLEGMPFTLNSYAVCSTSSPLGGLLQANLIFWLPVFLAPHHPHSPTPRTPPHVGQCFCFSIFSESLRTPCLGCLTFFPFHVTSCCLYLLKLRLSPKSPLPASNSDSIINLISLIFTMSAYFSEWFAACLHVKQLFRALKPGVLFLV